MSLTEGWKPKGGWRVGIENEENKELLRPSGKNNRRTTQETRESASSVISANDFKVNQRLKPLEVENIIK